MGGSFGAVQAAGEGGKAYLDGVCLLVRKSCMRTGIVCKYQLAKQMCAPAVQQVGEADVGGGRDSSLGSVETGSVVGGL